MWELNFNIQLRKGEIGLRMKTNTYRNRELLTSDYKELLQRGNLSSIIVEMKILAVSINRKNISMQAIFITP